MQPDIHTGALLHPALQCPVEVQAPPAWELVAFRRYLYLHQKVIRPELTMRQAIALEKQLRG